MVSLIMADTTDVSRDGDAKIVFKAKKRKPLRTREVQSDDSDEKEEEVDL